jgi:hypothetical protein
MLRDATGMGSRLADVTLAGGRSSPATAPPSRNACQSSRPAAGRGGR